MHQRFRNNTTAQCARRQQRFAAATTTGCAHLLVGLDRRRLLQGWKSCCFVLWVLLGMSQSVQLAVCAPASTATFCSSQQQRAHLLAGLDHRLLQELLLWVLLRVRQ
jgi:hypothetical protein